MSEELQQADLELDDAPSEGMDMDAAVGTIAEGLGFGEQNQDDELLAADDAELALESGEEADAAAVEEVAAPVTTVQPAPQSWAKDKHEIWAKMPAEARDYYMQREKQMLDGLQQYADDAKFGKPLKEAIMPYMPMITAHGITAEKAVQSLLNAQHQLDSNPKAGLIHIAQAYGIDLAELAQSAGTQQQVDPQVRALQEKVNALESGFTQREQAALGERRSQVAGTVEAFWKDPVNVYADEVAQDMIPFLQAGVELKDAYDKAVWANPVTRAKEQNRIQNENEKKLRENARLDALKAKKAASSNVNGRDTRRAPTEPSGKLFSTDHDAEMRAIVRKSTAH